MGVTTYLTHEIHNSLRITEFTKHGISFMADNLILLQYWETSLEVKRMIRIVKMRSSSHEMDMKEFIITKDGFMILDAND